MRGAGAKVFGLMFVCKGQAAVYDRERFERFLQPISLRLHRMQPDDSGQPSVTNSVQEFCKRSSGLNVLHAITVLYCKAEMSDFGCSLNTVLFLHMIRRHLFIKVCIFG
ncbi:hypothetical protein Trydic_g11652 [Trypoxylus dichotomus]